jgi:SnoaL-like protein
MTGPASDSDRRNAIDRFFTAIQAGDFAVLQEVLTPDAITLWPQSGERMTGAMSCIRVYENYPGGPPQYVVRRISGGDLVWVAELVADYGDARWYTVSVIEFDGARIARMTDYFGPSLPAPEWRAEWVEREAPEAP